MTINQKILETILDKETLYYHCAWHGVIYQDKEKTIPLVDVMKLTEVTHLTEPFKDYNITSGICDKCFDIYHQQKSK